jgi:hypothetical protein
MYLRRLEKGHRFVQRRLLGLTQAFAPRAPVGVVKILMYRPEYFGAPFCRVGQVLMREGRQTTTWTVGERELMGAFTSKLNQCVF